MGLRVLNEKGEEVTPIMGSYGIGIERILSAAVELYHDKDGIVLPASIAPFDVVVTPVNNGDAAQKEAAESIYRQALAAGLDALLDDRDERPGVKFKDADLIGIPYRITVGKKLANGMVEVVARNTRKSSDTPVDEAAATVAGLTPRGLAGGSFTARTSARNPPGSSPRAGWLPRCREGSRSRPGRGCLPRRRAFDPGIPAAARTSCGVSAAALRCCGFGAAIG